MSDKLLKLESDFFEDGSRDFYRRVVDDEAVLTVPGMGRLSKQQCVDAAGETPPWTSHKIDNLQRVQVAEGVVALTYHVVASRKKGDPYEAWMSSVWRKNGDHWQLVVHQQTPV